MIVRRDSLWFRTLMFLWSPTPWLPPLFPLPWTEAVRVGENTDDYIRITLRKPKGSKVL